MTSIHIVARKNGVGIDRDVAIMEDVLQPIANVDYRSQKCPESWAVQLRALFRFSQTQAYPSLYLLTERIPTLIGRLPGSVAVIPNQERFPHRHVRRLKDVDVVFCKTRHAQKIFDDLSCNTEYIGFTSVDRQLPDVAPDFERFFHLAGRSTLKGTSVLLEAWKRNPEWPCLTVIQAKKKAPSCVPHNVELITDFVSDEDLRQMQNEHGVHVCPSLSEGWGHYIVEAMSCGALTMTTDGPPMNELVSPDRGVLIPWEHSEPRHLGTNWLVSVSAVEKAVERILKMSGAEKAQIALAARKWYEANDFEFRERFSEVVLRTVGQPVIGAENLRVA